jgi:hypothetical protein
MRTPPQRSVGADRLRRVSHTQRASARAEHVCIIQGMKHTLTCERGCCVCTLAKGSEALARRTQPRRRPHLEHSRSPTDGVCLQSSPTPHPESFLGGRKSRPGLSSLAYSTHHHTVAPLRCAPGHLSLSPQLALARLLPSGALSDVRSRTFAERVSAPLSPIRTQRAHLLRVVSEKLYPFPLCSEN